MFKKIALIAACAAATGLPALAQGRTINTELDGRRLYFNQAPMMMGGRVMVPLRSIFESLGAQVTFDPTTQTINAARDQRLVKLQLGSNLATVDGRTVRLDAPATTISGNTMVPLRFVSEALGNKVTWNNSTRTVSLMSTNAPTLSTTTQNPAQAQVLSIAAVTHNASQSVKQGDRLVVNVNGTPGCQGTFDVVGIATQLPLREVKPGRYRGEMVVLAGMKSDQASVLATLNKTGKHVSKESDNRASINYGGTVPAVAYSGNDRMEPADGSIINTSRPEVAAGFSTLVKPTTVHLFLDGKDVTSASQVRNGRMAYRPGQDLAEGKHVASATATDMNGNSVRHDWTFRIKTLSNQ